jgi:transaldolase
MPFLRGSKRSQKTVNSVISVFVSRIDRALDELLVRSGIAPALSGIYNAALIYAEIQKMSVDGCRVLFASTGTKDISLPVHYYISGLLAYNSVNTAPIETILSFHTDGSKRAALPIEATVLLEHFDKLVNIGVDFEALLDKQISDGLVLFKEAFRDILEAL